MASSIENPILNGPYDVPGRHWKQDSQGRLTDEIAEQRRPSESWIPVPQTRKRPGARSRVGAAQGAAFAGGLQGEFDVTITGERKDVNNQINLVRADVDRWRAMGYPGVTPTTRRLLEYWADPTRDNRIFFAQREAVETTIYVTEVAGRMRGQGGETSSSAHSTDWIRAALEEQNAEYNSGLPRMALKMATGTGKTVVMAMLIAWQTLNKAASRSDSRFTNRFLVVTPGITIRDRLRVLFPSDSGNYYRERDLVPADLWHHLSQARLAVTNFHSFMIRTRQDGKGVAANTKKLLTARTGVDPFIETEQQMVERVLRDLGGTGKGAAQVMVINDEAHHCYAPRDAEAAVKALEAAERGDAKAANEEAGIWFTGLQRIHRHAGIKQIVDLSATPYFLKGSGYPEGYIYPWVVSDFSLMDAVESGLVKIPRLPVADDAEGPDVAYRDLWELVKDDLPSRTARGGWDTTRPLPAVLAGALQSLYGSYTRAFVRWQDSGAEGAPPVFIVVCPNTTVSKWVYDRIAGHATEVRDADGNEVPDRGVAGDLPLFSNYKDGERLPSPRTILVDSAELESGEAISKAFRDVAAEEIEAFRREYAARTGATTGDIDDAQLLREVLNTVGKPGRLGGGVRCVVSVSMLSEGWDANTVTHVLGVRAFGSQLLCEQVVGRGLRRRHYDIGDDGLMPPEYAEVYGIPFALLPANRPVTDPPATNPSVIVRTVEGREQSRIVFPRVDGYRFEVPDPALIEDLDDLGTYRVTLEGAPTVTEVQGIIGAPEVHSLDDLRNKRPREVAFKLAVHHLLPLFADGQGVAKPWLVPDLVRITEKWLSTKVEFAEGAFPGLLLLGTRASQAAEALARGIHTRRSVASEPRVQAIFRPDAPTGSTDGVLFSTTKAVVETNSRCHVSHVVLDSGGGAGWGNTWEQLAMAALEDLPEVAAYVKNDHLEFAIPYTDNGIGRRYKPDFIARLVQREGDVERYLVVEVSGSRKDQRTRAVKADVARHLWCAAVNADGRFGTWGYVEIDDPVQTKPVLRDAIANLYADAAITGVPLDPFEHEDDDLLHFEPATTQGDHR